MRQEITARQFFDGETLFGPTRITLVNDVVHDITSHSGQFDFDLVSPGLVDVQMNGFENLDIAQANSADLVAIDERLCELGTTSWLGTVVTHRLHTLSAILKRLDDVYRSDTVNGFCGIHLEGPFLGDSLGAHRQEWVVPIDIEWLTTLPSSIRLMTIGAEQANFATATRLLEGRGIAVSIGHSRPTRAQFDAALNSGASMVTHLFNAMSGIHHREDGLALMALLSDNIFLGLIADLVHVSPDAISHTFQSASDGRVCLVSDSVAWLAPGLIAKGVAVTEGAPRLPDGTLAGSSTPLAVCVANVVQKCSVPLHKALRAATSTPANVIGRRDLGRIVRGQPADLVAFDSNLRVVSTMRRLPSSRA